MNTLKFLFQNKDPDPKTMKNDQIPMAWHD